MPVIILMHVMAHPPYRLGLEHCKINTNEQFFEGSHLLYLTGSFWIDRIEVRYFLFYYVLLNVVNRYCIQANAKLSFDPHSFFEIYIF